MTEEEREDLRLVRLETQHLKLRSRHSSALTHLLEERKDLTGVHAMADFVTESVRWSA
ncbi:hypothetical protein [Nocardioides perillae]|uniref:Uncharacterized protein n=1 Tax=Nocardioides perillae TaxID=1119534 RepID=A0A7Y9UUY8_9ACTN|nr:hypothetical protein [Nocardioides perillae]NYG54420.1 hypothetical protein [Nocardioides perillae]